MLLHGSGRTRINLHQYIIMTFDHRFKGRTCYCMDQEKGEHVVKGRMHYLQTKSKVRSKQTACIGHHSQSKMNQNQSSSRLLIDHKTCSSNTIYKVHVDT